MSVDPVEGVIVDDLPADYGEDQQAESLAAGDAPDLLAPVFAEPGCPHPPSARRLIDGEQVCTSCGEAVEPYERQAIVPKDRPGTDPTMREETAGGLRHVTVPREGDTGRPYTPDQIERELVVIIDRIERGAGWLTSREEERAAAKLQYELAYAKARFNSDARSSEQRSDDALLQCRDLYEEWQQLELVCRTAREGLHNLRSMPSGLQTVARSIGTALGGYR
jgi:hypothetical protein